MLDSICPPHMWTLVIMVNVIVPCYCGEERSRAPPSCVTPQNRGVEAERRHLFMAMAGER